MWIERTVSAHLKELTERRPAVLVTGCRQTGKTALVRHLFPQAGYASLDIPAEAAFADDNGEAFLLRHPSPLIVDEVQYARNLFRYLKARIDQNRDQNGQYILTGSQTFELMSHTTESLAGRISIIELHPLSLLELERGLGRVAEGNQLAEWMQMGGYPELHTASIPAEEFYGDYVATYLERDVRQILQVRNLREFDRFLRLAAVRTGQIFAPSTFAADLGVSANTVKSWLGVLEASGIIAMVEPYFENLGKRIIKSPKLYFLDTGLCCYLAGIRTPSALVSSALLGAFFETHVYSQLRRYLAGSGRRTPIYYYRDQSGTEIDFLLTEGEKLRLIEVKWSENPRTPHPSFETVARAAGVQRILSQTLITPRRGARTSNGVLITDSVDWSWVA